MKSITDITIRNYHIDHFGHVNHARCVELLEEARWRYLEENGLLAPIHEAGASHVVAKIEIDYRRSARINDVLQVETRVHGRSDHNFRILQRATLKESRKTVFEAMVTNVFVAPQGRTRPIDGKILEIWPDLAGAPRHSVDPQSIRLFRFPCTSAIFYSYCRYLTINSIHQNQHHFKTTYPKPRPNANFRQGRIGKNTGYRKKGRGFQTTASGDEAVSTLLRTSAITPVA